MNKKLYLPIIIAALVLTMWIVYGKGQKNTPGRQAWEYKSIIIVRSAKTNAEFSDWAEISGEVVKQLPLPVSVPAKAKDLGDQGWELVSVTPISNNTCPDCGGFTSQIIYWLKRPK
jgi:hypothetical protein